MPNAFNFSASPFDALTLHEQRLVRDHVDVAYFRPGEVILDVGEAPSHLFVIIKGQVSQFDEAGQQTSAARFGPDDCFDGRALVAGKASSRFVAAEEVLAYALARQTVHDLIAANSAFGALLFSDLGAKLSVASQRQSGNELQTLNMARVDAAFIRPAVVVDASADVLSVVRIFHEQKSTNVLVRDSASAPPRLGMFTTTSLQKAVLHGAPLHTLAVGQMASYPLITVQAGDQVGEALALMLRNSIHRLVVMDGEEIRGVLESLDVFSFLSNHSHLIAMQMDDAASLDELERAAGQINAMIGRQFRGGTRVSLIARLVQDLNARLFDRAWRLVAPAEVRENTCLFVMGSEGRGEQLLKTDQDNALVWRDDWQPPASLPAICERFSHALERFGYPPCPGGIMLSQGNWRMSAGDFARTARQWLARPEPAQLMNLAIFMDAQAVSGDAALLQRVRASLFDMATDNAGMQAHFASAIDLFGSSSGWWNRLLGEGDQRLDLKKQGLFPLVHGVRSLALAARIPHTSTAERLQALVQAGQIDENMARDVLESLHFFMTLRLKAGLGDLPQPSGAAGGIDPRSLSSFERDLLKDALDVVKRFKAQLRHRFRLGAL